MTLVLSNLPTLPASEHPYALHRQWAAKIT